MCDTLEVPDTVAHTLVLWEGEEEGLVDDVGLRVGPTDRVSCALGEEEKLPVTDALDERLVEPEKEGRSEGV